MKHALPKVFRTFLGVTPMFIGIAMLGVCLFYTTYSFQYFSDAAMTLISLTYGDELQNVYRDITGYRLFLGAVYLFFYVFFGIA